MTFVNSWLDNLGSNAGGSVVTQLGGAVGGTLMAEPDDPDINDWILFVDLTGALCLKINLAGLIYTAKLMTINFMGGSGEYPNSFLSQG